MEYTDKNMLIEELERLKKVERTLVRLNGNNKDAINKRIKSIEETERNITEIYNDKIVQIELRKVALFEIMDEVVCREENIHH